MVCSTCGYENQAGNRFCGMCGTPLPHRPLTTPGAQGTASLTRALAENGRPMERNGVAGPVTPARIEVEPQYTRDLWTRSETSSQRTEMGSERLQSANLTLSSGDTTLAATQPSTAPPPQFDLVPEVPLDEYVQNFRYVPPSDPKEITMRGEAPVLEPEPPAPSNASSVMQVETAIASAEAASPSAEDDVRERLGLEVNDNAEQRKDRPRFLEFNEPPSPLNPDAATPFTDPSIPRPSEVPQLNAEAGDEIHAEEPSHGKWRIWLATAAVLVFAFLGALEWRSQVRQTNNGPIEFIKMEMRRLGRTRPPETASNESAAPATALDPSSKPAIPVEPSSEDQKGNAPGTTMPVGGEPVAGEKDASTPPGTKAATAPVANTAAVTHAPTGNQAASAEPASTPLRNTAQNAAPTSVGQNTAGAKSPTASGPGDRSKLNALQQPGSVAAPTADQPKPSPRGAGDVGDAVAKKAIPGAEEIAKANNASDSVAEAAWLWKATAKGNPDAPVRLADMYIKGNGVPRSCEQAMVLLKTAATKANALARNRLASMYNSGTCVARNRVEAYRWLSSALVANPNSEWARQNRDSIWQQMTAEERTQAERYR